MRRKIIRNTIMGMIFMFTLVVSGCSMETAGNDSGIEEQKTKIERQLPEIKETLLYNGKVNVTVKGIEQNGPDYRVNLFMENVSDTDISIFEYSYGINSVMVRSEKSMDCMLTAGESKDVYFDISTVLLDENGIGEINYIQLLLFGKKENSSQNSFRTDIMLIETESGNGESDIPDGAFLLDEQGVYVDFIDRNGDSFTFMITNNSCDYLQFDISDVSVNGCTMTELEDSLKNNTVLCNNAFLCTVTVDEEFKATHSIKKIEKLEWSLVCRPNGDFAEEYELGPIRYEVE